MAKIIGLTGNIACGKSTVGQILSARGIPVLDSDQVVQELYASDEKVRARILEEFGTLDRKIIGQMVFGTSIEAKSQRKKLENILHPAVDLKFREWIKANNREPILVNLVPLIFEAQLEYRYDYIVVVASDPEIQKTRLKERNPEFSDDELNKRIQSQISQDYKISHSQYVIYNNSDIIHLEKEVDELISKLSGAI